MAVAYQTGVATNSAANVSTLTSASMTVSGSNAYLLALVVSGAGTPVAPSAVKWGGSGGTSMTQVGTTLTFGTYWKASLYELVAPTAGASTLYVDYGTNQDETGVIGVLYTGVDQTTPRGTVGTGFNDNSHPMSATCTTVSGDTVVGAIFIGTNLAGFTDSQTVRQSWAEIAAGYELASVGDKTASGASTTVNWSTTYSAPWGAFAVPLKAGAAGTTITPGSGSITLAGAAPTVAATGSKSITPGAGAVVLAGAAPTVASSASKSITPPSGAVVLSGAVPVQTLTLPAPGAGSIVLTGYAPTVTNGASVALTPGAGAIVLAGAAPTVSKTANLWVTPGAGAVVLSGAAPGVLSGASKAITPAAGAVVLAGAAPSLATTANKSVTPAAGAIVVAGSAPTVVRTANQWVTPPAGAVTLGGYAPVLTETTPGLIRVPAGAVVLTGYAPTVDAPGSVAVSSGLHPMNPIRRVSRYSMRIGGRLVFADSPKALQAAIVEFEREAQERARIKARAVAAETPQAAPKKVARSAPRLTIVDAPQADLTDLRAEIDAANERIRELYEQEARAALLAVAIEADLRARAADDEAAIVALGI